MNLLNKPFISYPIYKITSSGDIFQIEDFIAKEIRVRLIINNKEVSSFYASPIHLKELIVGFLYNEGLIKENFCLENIELTEKESEVIANVSLGEILDSLRKNAISEGLKEERFLEHLTSDPNKKKRERFKISKKKITELFKDFQKRSELFKITGCFHSACLCDKENLLFFTEDIGRHNTVDKVIGFSLLNKIPLTDKILMLSGRISCEMMLKMGKWGIPLIVARGAPTSLAIELAKKQGITLVGFIREEKFNIYCYPEKIVI